MPQQTERIRVGSNYCFFLVFFSNEWLSHHALQRQNKPAFCKILYFTSRYIAKVLLFINLNFIECLLHLKYLECIQVNFILAQMEDFKPKCMQNVNENTTFLIDIFLLPSSSIPSAKSTDTHLS